MQRVRPSASTTSSAARFLPPAHSRDTAASRRQREDQTAYEARALARTNDRALAENAQLSAVPADARKEYRSAWPHCRLRCFQTRRDSDRETRRAATTAPRNRR